MKILSYAFRGSEQDLIVLETETIESKTNYYKRHRPAIHADRLPSIIEWEERADKLACEFARTKETLSSMTPIERERAFNKLKEASTIIMMLHTFDSTRKEIKYPRR